MTIKSAVANTGRLIAYNGNLIVSGAVTGRERDRRQRPTMAMRLSSTATLQCLRPNGRITRPALIEAALKNPAEEGAFVSGADSRAG
jgi:hypothetical protein